MLGAELGLRRAGVGIVKQKDIRGTQAVKVAQPGLERGTAGQLGLALRDTQAAVHSVKVREIGAQAGQALKTAMGFGVFVNVEMHLGAVSQNRGVQIV